MENFADFVKENEWESLMLDVRLKTQLQSYLQNLSSSVELELVLDSGDKSRELEQLASEIAGLSNHINVSRASGYYARKPSMKVKSLKMGTEITFAGIPMGHEFNSLVLALLHSGGHPVKLDDELIEQVRSLPEKYNFETYVSLSCQNCPDVVQALNMMAAINPNITHTMIDGALFQNEVDDRKVMAVPSVFMNGKPFAQGRISVQEILAKLDTGAESRQAERISQKEPFDVLVVGGGPAGTSAAIYAARKGIRTGIVADRFGGQVLDTVGIENFISVKATEGPKLVSSLEEHVRDYDVDIITGQKAANIIDAKQPGGFVQVELESGAVLKSRSLIMATGARWREMNVPGEQVYKGAGVAYCPHCDGPLFKGKKVAVIGGGNSGIEAAIDLAGIVEHVTVLEFDDKLRADEVLQRKARSLPNIDIITSALTTEVRGDGQQVTGITYTNRITDESKQIELSGVFVQIGLVPNAEFLKSTLELSPHGEIIVGGQGETSMPGVFAAGDVTTAPYKQIIIAMGSGASAALGAFDYLLTSSHS